MAAPRFAFRVVIEQEEPEQKRNFGTAAEWAEVIRQLLQSKLQVANVVEVRPLKERT